MIDDSDTPQRQIAALPVRRLADGSSRVLLVTSRETRRWIIPKGWPIKGMKDHRAAALEALEEAGVAGRVSRQPVGSYRYWKRLSGCDALCEVAVHLLEVDEELDEWREKGQRQLVWLRPREAAARVAEADLRLLILAID